LAVGRRGKRGDDRENDPGATDQGHDFCSSDSEGPRRIDGLERRTLSL
jgi:hypothetical protein